jgi:hypothetical protein
MIDFRQGIKIYQGTGFHVVEFTVNDPLKAIALSALETKGYVVNAYSHRGTTEQYVLVTKAKQALLQEQMHHSCRNSLSGLTLPVVNT